MNTDTKRHIDAARQILVGVVPNPSTQIDQITNALIYKFMDDMDQSVIKIGGKPNFFIGDLEKYAWVRIMDPRVGSQERMNLYSEALLKFSQAKQLPPLFRDIFKLAVLPYRSPEVLDLFLKEINYFDYSHSEELGNAFEYLLSIMGSQGDAGQFRTPRHIIEFIVDVVNPTKDDKVLDPACGTAGFLISAYKHILEQHDGKDDPKKIEKPLTPEQKKKLTNNFIGYDISPEMVRLSRVNMYLHNFKDPQIIAYNTLADEEHWNDKFDVILANPPFMSPKGAGKPHSKFTIQASKSEVLFVDYIMNHLRPKGRAGIIVPEGIIFQSGIAYKQLRKNLVEDGLYAVVSLPSGVFAPYSGVKTSILFFDNELSKRSKEILFIKIEDDGFELGATRRPSKFNELPHAIETIEEYKKYVLEGNQKEIDRVVSENGSLASTAKKTKIAENGDYNLSIDRYRVATDYTNAKWPMVELGEVCEVSAGNSAPQDKALFENGKYPFFRTSDVGAVHLSDNLKDVRDWLNDKGIVGLKLFKKGTILFPKSGASTFLNHRVAMGFDGYVSSHLATITPKESIVNSKYIFQLLVSIDAKTLTPDQAYPSLKISEIAKIKIPLPPLEIQEQIVAELDGYQNIITGAKQIVASWKPSFIVDPRWPIKKLSEISERVTKGTTPTTAGFSFQETGINFVKIEAIDDAGYFLKNKFAHINEECNKVFKRSQLKSGDVLFSIAGALGRVALVQDDILPANTNQALAIITPKDVLDSKYLEQVLRSSLIFDKIDGLKVGVAQYNISLTQVSDFDIPLPSLEIQKQIVEKIEAERILVESSKKLIAIYDQKTKEVIAKLWTE